jgi:hypothetical protein
MEDSIDFIEVPSVNDIVLWPNSLSLDMAEYFILNKPENVDRIKN